MNIFNLKNNNEKKSPNNLWEIFSNLIFVQIKQTKRKANK